MTAASANIEHKDAFCKKTNFCLDFKWVCEGTTMQLIAKKYTLGKNGNNIFSILEEEKI